MKLSIQDINILLDKFPKNIEPYYDNFNHNKVINNNIVYIVVPQGKKCLIWFSIYNNQNVCIVLEISFNKENKEKQFDNIYFIQIPFDNTLSYNSIFYGVIINIYDNNKLIKYISIDNIFYYKGKYVYKYDYKYKLEIFKEFFENDIKNIYQPFLGLSIIDKDYNILKNNINELPYKVKGIKQIYLNNNNTYSSIKHYETNIDKKINNNIVNNNIVNNNKKISSFIFIVKPDIKTDIYKLYTLDNNIEVFHSIAYIDNYNTSVMMNNIFRNIKENTNIDLIEESDDEDFENNMPEKYVKLDKTEIMICNYSSKFKKFIPVSITNNKNNIVSSMKLKKYNI